MLSCVECLSGSHMWFFSTKNPSILVFLPFTVEMKFPFSIFAWNKKKYDRSAQKPSIKRPTNKRDLSYMNIEQIICESRNIRKVNKIFGFPSGAHIMGFFSECVRKRSKPSYRLSYAFFLIWFPVCAPHDEGFEVDNSRSHP